MNRKRITMKKFLSEKDPVERERLRKNQSKEARRNMMFNARRKTKRSIEWLVFYAENVSNVTENPDLEFSRVFTPQVLLCWGKIGEALKKGIFYTNSSMLTHDQVVKLSADLSNENIVHDPIRLHRDIKYLNKMQEELFLKKPWKKAKIIERMLSGETVKLSDYKSANFG
jgi:hypothetical protein